MEVGAGSLLQMPAYNLWATSFFNCPWPQKPQQRFLPRSYPDQTARDCFVSNIAIMVLHLAFLKRQCTKVFFESGLFLSVLEFVLFGFVVKVRKVCKARALFFLNWWRSYRVHSAHQSSLACTQGLPTSLPTSYKSQMVLCETIFVT